MRAIRVDGTEYQWGPRGTHVIVKTPQRRRLQVRPEDMSPPGAAPTLTPHDVGPRHVRWYILAFLTGQPDRADREARRQAKRERKARRRQAPPPPVTRGAREVYIVIAERGAGARYSWGILGVYDHPETAHALADGRNRKTHADLRQLDPMVPACKPVDVHEVIERRDPWAWRYRVERRFANHDPAPIVEPLTLSTAV